MARWFEKRAIRILLVMVAVSTGVIIGKTYGGYFKPYFTQPKPASRSRQFVSPLPPKTTATIGKINILNADNVAGLKKENRCVPLKTAGGKLICYDTKDKFIGPLIANTGAWEIHVWNPMLKILSEDPELGLIDIGANIGVFTVSAAALGRRVVAVEAFYENIQRMSESLRLAKLTDKVTIVYNAVSNVYEDVFFWRPVDNPGGTHTLSKGVTLAPNKPVFKGDHSKVNTIFMDDLPHIIPFSKAVLKIDIEGYENKAFKKAEILLDSLYIRVLFMEWTFVKSSDDCLNIVKILMTRGYSPHNLYFQPLKGTTRPEMAGWPGDIVWLKPKPTKHQVNAKARDVVRSPVQITVSNGYNINIMFPATVPSVAENVDCVPLKTAKNNLICIDSKDKFIGPVIQRTGSWEPELWQMMEKFLVENPEAGVIDIGANIGVFTLAAAAMGRKVIAVEAFYENVQRLCESIRLGNFSDKVTVVHNAVSDVYETVNFWRPADNPGGTHTLSEGVTLSPQKPSYVGPHNSVTTIHLDDLVHIRKFTRQAIMKIDIEGYEIKAFKSAEKLLDNIDIKALFMEWTFITKDASCLHIVNIMTKRNYKAHSMDLKPLAGIKYDEVRKWPNAIVWVKKR